MVLAQSTQWLLLITEDLGLNRVTENLYGTFIYFLLYIKRHKLIKRGREWSILEMLQVFAYAH